MDQNWTMIENHQWPFTGLSFYYPAVPYPLIVATPLMLTTSPQTEKAVATDTKISCGVGPAKILSLDEDRIIGGTEAVPNSWPGIVSFN